MNVSADWLQNYKADLDLPSIEAERARAVSRAMPSGLPPQLRGLLANPPAITASELVFDQAVVRIGRKEDASAADLAELRRRLESIMPWKKGPFDFFGIEIDAEWRSDIKWQRFQPYISSLSKKKVADIGCHNGYFMFRMLAQDPDLVVGFEPVLRHALTFQFIQNYARQERLVFELLGVEAMDLFQGFFDTVFCLGILYHHRDPVGLLQKIKTSMSLGSELFVDCQAIPGAEDLALMPRGRYAGASGVWWLPTTACLETWLRRAGFAEIEIFYAEPLTSEEQRPTNWAPIRSLDDFLDPSDPSKTIEGYPAPWRIYAKAVKR